MRKGLRSLRVRNQIALVFSLVFLAIVLLQTLGSMLLVSNSVSAQANDYILQTLQQTTAILEETIDSYRKLANTLASNTTIQDVLERNNERARGQASYAIPYEDSRLLQMEISKLSIAYDGINSIQIIAPSYVISYNFVSDSPFDAWDLTDAELARLHASNGDTVLLSIRREQSDKLHAKALHVFSAARKIFRFGVPDELAYMFINIQEPIIRSVIGGVNIGPGGSLELFDVDGLILSAHDTQLIGTRADPLPLKQGHPSPASGYEIADGILTAYHFSDALQWGVVTRLPVDQVAQALSLARQLNIVIGVGGILLLAAASYLLAKQLTKPLELLVESMTQIRANHLDTRVQIAGGMEVSQLGQTFNDMVDELDRIIRHNIQMETLSKEARLRAIQAQINPHFLYNTLDTIYWKLVMAKEEETAELVISLSEMLRYSISGSSERLVSLRRELNNLRHYQKIQNARFRDRIAWEMDIGQGCEGLYMPKMILQPLVENAVLHGMDSSKERLAINIRARCTGDRLVLVVSDNGKGIPGERLAELLKDPARDGQEKGEGFGLSGAHRQVQLRFGPDFGLSLESEVGQGTRITVTLPALDHDKEVPVENLVGG